ncbi:MAG: DUF3160 domain-containing protein [Spirochaetales bacterium]|nr:DUF3160 domain-containing protein [Spirochaetales bacterium]
MRPILFTIIIIFITSCSQFIKKEQVEIVDIPENDTVINETVEVEPIVELPKEYSLNIKNYDVSFSTFPKSDISGEIFAVVSSREALIFPMVDLKTQKDIKKIKDGEPLPIGTVIPILETVDIKDTILENHFKYEGDLNYFYKTTINGNEGLVWGADVVIYKDLELADRDSYFYTKDEKSDKWYPFNGNYQLTSNIIKDLKDNRVAFEKTNESILTNYLNDSGVRSNSLFITTDFISSSSQVLISEVVQDKEDEIYIPELKRLVTLYIDEINKLQKDDTLKNELYTNTLVWTKNYFLMADLLLKYSNSSTKLEETLQEYPEEVVNEYRLLLKETGINNSLLLNRTIDFSMFLPQGYYLSNDSLFGYYMARTWLGQTGFTISEDNLDSVRISLLIYKLTQDSAEIKSLWSSLNNFYNYIYGESSFFNPMYFNTIMESNDFGVFSYFIVDNDNLYSFVTNSGIFSLFNYGVKSTQKLFSYLSSPSIENRNFASGLDLLATLGSKSAVSLLNQDEDQQEYFNKLYTKIEETAAKVTTYNEDYWKASLPNSFIKLASFQTTYEQNDDFYFTNYGKWNQKVLNSSLSTITRINNMIPTVNKKEFIEAKLKEPSDITFRTVNYLRPVHFIEPDLESFIYINKLLENALIILESEKIEDLIKINNQIIEIVRKENSGEFISSSENDFIWEIPRLLNKLIKSPKNYSPSYMVINKWLDKDSVKIGLVGYPNRIFIALKDNQGGRRIATGYTDSYYEFTIPSQDYLTIDKDIKSKLNEDSRPFWGKSTVK